MKLCASLLLLPLVLASSEASPSSLAALEEGLRLLQSSGVWSAMIVSQRKEEIPMRFQGHSLNIPLVAVDRSGLESVKHFPQGIIVLFGGGENHDDVWLRKLPEMHKVIIVGRQRTVERMRMEFAYSLHFVPDSSNSTEDQFQVFRRRPGRKGMELAESYRDGRFRGAGSSSLAKLEDAFEVRLDYGGQTLPAAAFTYSPYSLPDFESGVRHGGYEYNIAAAVTEGLNLKLKVSQPSLGGMWGFEVPSGSGNFTGM